MKKLGGYYGYHTGLPTPQQELIQIIDIVPECAQN